MFKVGATTLTLIPSFLTDRHDLNYDTKVEVVKTLLSMFIAWRLEYTDELFAEERLVVVDFELAHDCLLVLLDFANMMSSGFRM